MERRLVTILAADAVGYSRLVANDEDAALALFRACAAIIDDRIRAHNGRAFGGAGDSVIAEFASPVEALRCAVEIQSELARSEEGLAEDRRMLFRLGLNLGDVVVEQDNLLGEAVNIAARLEGMCNPGGICVSGSFYEQVKHLPGFSLHDAGVRRLKNILTPVHVYFVEGMGSAGVKRRFPVWGWPAVAALLALVAVPLWWTYTQEPATESGTGPQLASQPQPSIVVLPLTNVSGDPSQEYFSDGLTNDITTDLSKFSGLLVIANNSAMTYKGKPTKVQEIGIALGVRYALEGTVQRTPERLRINAQLIETENGHHVWAERYDRVLGDVFDVQEDIMRTIVTALAVKVNAAEQRRASRKRPQNMDAYDYYLQGKAIWADPSKVTVEGNNEARQLFENAIALDPMYSAAYAELSYVYVREYQNGWSADPDASLRKAEVLAKKALDLDDHFSSHWYLAIVAWNKGNFDESFYQYEKARQINPNDPDLAADMGEALIYGGEPERAIAQIRGAMLRNPEIPFWYWWNLGRGYYMAKKYREAIDAIAKIADPPNDVRLITAASEAQLGNLDSARAIMAEFSKNDPSWSIEQSAAYYYKKDTDRQLWIDGLRKAGLKEK